MNLLHNLAWSLPEDALLWAVLIVGIISLIGLFIRHRKYLHWTGYTMMNIAFAAIGLYLINTLEILGDFAIPLSILNMIIVATLGLPGIALITAAHHWIFV